MPKEEVDWSEDEPEEPEQRQRRIQKEERKAERKAAKRARKEERRRAKEEAGEELPESEPPESNPPGEGLPKAEVPQEELPQAEPSEEGLPKTETKAELPKAECASGSTGSKGELGKDIDFDKVDLQLLWAKHNTDSEGEYESLSSTECNDPEPIVLKPTAKQKAVRPKPTAKPSSRRKLTKTVRLKSVRSHPLRLRSAIRLKSVQRGIRPDRHPFRKLVDLEGKEGPKYSRPVQHQPTTTRRPVLVDAETGIEHRLTEAGYWLPVLGAAHRTGKARSKASKYKQKAERKAKAIARKEAAATPPWREQAKGSGSSGSGYWKA